MAIKNFKTIVDNKAYMINEVDRKIFETGELASFFGLSVDNNIEFIIYDANDNQLPQGEYGLVRYIPMTTEAISEYILIPEGTLMTQHNFPTEYFVDVERLLNDAGYTNGIFKTQITLINRRVGSERTDDKLWIKEISPTRTEVRLMPMKGLGTPKELQHRLNIFINDSNFAEDILPTIPKFLEQINPAVVDEYISHMYSEQFLNRLRTEYQIPDMDVFATRIHTQFVKDAKTEFEHYVSPELSMDTLKLKCVGILKAILSKELVSVGAEAGSSTLTTDASVDVSPDIIQVRTAQTVYGITGDVIENIVIQKPAITAEELLLNYKMSTGDDTTFNTTPEPNILPAKPPKYIVPTLTIVPPAKPPKYILPPTLNITPNTDGGITVTPYVAPQNPIVTRYNKNKPTPV